VRLLTEPSQRENSRDDEKGTITLDTPKGPVLIYPQCTPGFFRELRLDSGLGHFSHYSSIIQKLEVFEKIASGKDGRVSLGLVEDKVVVAYGVGYYPDSTERWSRLGDLMYEVAAIEVSRHYRNMKIADVLLAEMVNDELFEEKILYMNGYSWHWDLDGKGLTMIQYRKMMMNFFRKHGFQEYYTNEPNIAIREENLFMARIGSKVSPEDQQRFRNLRFGIVNR